VLLQEIRDYIVDGDAGTMVVRFQNRALEYSDDTESNAKGGDLGWFGKGKTANTIEIEEEAFALQPGEVSEIFEKASGWHLVWQQNYDPNHPIDQETLDARAQEKYDAWKAEAVARATVARFPPPTPTPPPTPPPFVPTLAPTVEPTTEPVTATVTP
jgi:hypothetical protein